MKAIIEPSKLDGALNIVPSKSHAHRLLIAAALAEKPGCVNVPAISDDLIATKTALEALFNGKSKKEKPWQPVVLDCKESGSTLRFLLPVSMVFRRNVTFKRSGKLPERPLFPLDREMHSHGCSFVTNENTGDLIVRGKLQGGQYILPGDVSSQFVTGLLFALPLTSRGAEIKVKKPVESKPYIILTISVLKKFGISLSVRNSKMYETYTLEGGQKYTPPSWHTKKKASPLLEAEGDWSNAAFWIAANALGSKITVRGLDENSDQGDKEITTVVGNMLKAKEPLPDGGDKNTEDAVIIDARNIPDLVPVISILAHGLNVKTKIINAERLRLKESDRLYSMAENLRRLGGEVELTKDSMTIYENTPPAGSLTANEPIRLDGFNDHRIVMSCAIASLFTKQTIEIDGCEAVKKSYPEFFTEFQKLGGNVTLK